MYGKAEEETGRDLREALQSGLVLQERGPHRLCARPHPAKRLTRYSSRRAVLEMHLRVGRLLFEHTPAERLQERLFDIVTQLDLGLTFVTDQAERLRIAELNLRAGRKAEERRAPTSSGRATWRRGRSCSPRELRTATTS